MPKLVYHPDPAHKTRAHAWWGGPKWSPKRQPPATACQDDLPLYLPKKWLRQALDQPDCWATSTGSKVDPQALGHGYPRHLLWYDSRWGWFEGRRTQPGPDVFEVADVAQVEYEGYPMPRGRLIPSHVRRHFVDLGTLDAHEERRHLDHALTRYGKKPKA